MLEHLTDTELPSGLKVFVIIHHQKSTISGDAKESSAVLELKRLVEGILQGSPAQQQLRKITSY